MGKTTERGKTISTVEGKKYRRDVFLLPDGTVKQRKDGFWMFGSHNIKKVAALIHITC